MTSIQNLLAISCTLILCCAACGSSTPSASTSGSTGASTGGGGMGGGGEARCPVGQVPAGQDGCQSVGIQHCAPIFIDPDGVCRPSMARCAAEPGTIPRFDQGCVPVGIPNCAPEFVEDDALCHPSMDKCAGKPGTFAVPQMGCVPIDGPQGCGAAPWGNIADGPNTVYVDPSYTLPDSDGTKTKPLQTIAQALSVVPAGGRVALSAGTFDESVSIQKSVTIEGRCPSMTRISPSSSSIAAVVSIASATDVTLTSLQISGSNKGIVLSAGAGATLDRVLVEQASYVGVDASGTGTTVTITHSWINDVLPEVSSGTFGSGVIALSKAVVTVSHSAITQNRAAGVVAYDADTMVTLHDTLVEGTQPQQSDGMFGMGVNVNWDASVHISASAFVRNRESGIIVLHSPTQAQVIDSLIEKTLAQASDGFWGLGANVILGGTLELTRNVISESSYTGARAVDAGSRLIMDGNLITKTDIPPGSRLGLGVLVMADAQATLHGDAIYQNKSAGVFSYSGATLTGSNVLIEQTQPSPMSGEDGAGALAYLSGPFTLDSCAIPGNTVAGIGIAGSQASISNSWIAGTKPGSFQEENGTVHEDFGDGIAAALFADLSVDRTIVENTARAGILFYQATGSITACESRANKYGVALQGMPQPAFDPADNSVRDSTEKDMLIDGALKIPTQAPEKP